MSTASTSPMPYPPNPELASDASATTSPMTSALPYVAPTASTEDSGMYTDLPQPKTDHSAPSTVSPQIRVQHLGPLQRGVEEVQDPLQAAKGEEEQTDQATGGSHPRLRTAPPGMLDIIDPSATSSNDGTSNLPHQAPTPTPISPSQARWNDLTAAYSELAHENTTFKSIVRDVATQNTRIRTDRDALQAKLNEMTSTLASKVSELDVAHAQILTDKSDFDASYAQWSKQNEEIQANLSKVQAMLVAVQGQAEKQARIHEAEIERIKQYSETALQEARDAGAAALAAASVPEAPTDQSGKSDADKLVLGPIHLGDGLIFVPDEVMEKNSITAARSTKGVVIEDKTNSHRTADPSTFDAVPLDGREQDRMRLGRRGHLPMYSATPDHSEEQTVMHNMGLQWRGDGCAYWPGGLHNNEPSDLIAGDEGFQDPDYLDQQDIQTRLASRFNRTPGLNSGGPLSNIYFPSDVSYPAHTPIGRPLMAFDPYRMTAAANTGYGPYPSGQPTHDEYAWPMYGATQPYVPYQSQLGHGAGFPRTGYYHPQSPAQYPGSMMTEPPMDYHHPAAPSYAQYHDPRSYYSGPPISSYRGHHAPLQMYGHVGYY